MNILLKTVLFISLLSLFGDCMKNSDQIGGKRKSTGIKIVEPNEVKGKGKVVHTSRKGKEKVGETGFMEDTTEQLNKMDIAQENAKMDIDSNAKPKQNEEKAPPKYVFIWRDNEKKNFEVDHKVIRLSEELTELFHAQDKKSVNANQGEQIQADNGQPENANHEKKQEALPVSEEEAKKLLNKVEEWYAHHRNDEHRINYKEGDINNKKNPILVFKCNDNVNLVLNVHKDVLKLSEIFKIILKVAGNKKYPVPILAPVENFKSDIMLKLIKMSEEYKYKPDFQENMDAGPMDLGVPTGEVAEASASNAQVAKVVEKVQFVPPQHIMQWDVKTDLEMVRAADAYHIDRLLNDKYSDNVFEIVKVKWINGKTPQEIRKAFGVEEPYPPGHPEWERVEKENEWEESDEEREARHAKEREEEEERERKDKEKERLRQEQQQQQQNQEQNQEHQQGQQHDEEQEHDEDMNDE
ncbi:hypothetical protein niasHS_004882 [Heterodera schachtii]|uniref:SKP1 component dimerisation domain-containing protein n=1 Tax=Heterodera schachtii TaxID=97005 RepID=A0ABD2JLP4_HETSC